MTIADEPHPLSAAAMVDNAAILTELRTELSSLNRVSHRLAMTDGGPTLERVLNLLLPRLLRRVGKNDDERRRCDHALTSHNNNHSNISSGNNKRKSPVPVDGVVLDGIIAMEIDESTQLQMMDAMRDAIHDKLIEMLGHAMKRVREDRKCKLPCMAILESLIPPAHFVVTTTTSEELLYSDKAVDGTTSNPLAINLGMAFLTLGINRCSASECASLLPTLLKFMGHTLDRRRGCGADDESSVGVGHLTDTGGAARHDKAWHLVLRCLESIGTSTKDVDFSGRVVLTPASVVASPDEQLAMITSLRETTRLIQSDTIIAASLFDLFIDVLLYTPVPASSSLVPAGLSESSYTRLIGGAASEQSGGCTSWKEEYASVVGLRKLKLKLLDLIAPCRLHALFLREMKIIPDNNDASCEGKGPTNDNDGGSMGMSRTVALMVLLTGDTDPNVRDKAESYLRSHMDTYRGKDVGSLESVHDALLGNSVALTHTILTFAIGGTMSMGIERTLRSQYSRNVGILGSNLGLSYHTPTDGDWKVLLSCSRMRISESTATPALKFVAKMLDDNPKIFHVGLDADLDEADSAAILIGTLILTIVGDLHRPGSSASPTLESAATLLNSLCVRLSLFYDARVRSRSNVSASLERLRSLLARSVKQACAVLAPTSTGESTSLANTGTRASGIQADIRDKCYGVICTLARSVFALDENYALFNIGVSNGKLCTSTASLLFGCSSNEVEMLKPRATSALDALLGATVRVVKFLVEKEKALDIQKELASAMVIDNPWANINDSIPSESKETKKDIIGADSLSRSLLPLLWNAARRNQPKSSRLASARWTSDLLLRLDDSSAFHLLCFLSGDDDATVSMIAKQGLGVEKSMGEDNILSIDLISPGGGDQDERVAFSVLMSVIVGSNSSLNSWPTYSSFPVIARAVTLRFLLQSLFSEVNFYGDENDGLALKEFVVLILSTLATYKGRSLSRDETDLIDECAIALASLTSTSKEARLLVAERDWVADGQFSFGDIPKQAMSSSSSKARVSEVSPAIFC